MGLPGKPTGFDGSDVEAMVEAGKIVEVSQYCESDVLNTYRLWLLYELFRGSLSPEQFTFSDAQVVDFAVTRRLDNPHLAASVKSTLETAEEGAQQVAFKDSPGANSRDIQERPIPL
jgi:hypothetical protein